MRNRHAQGRARHGEPESPARLGERARLLASERQAREAAESARGQAESAREEVTSILERITDAFFALDREWRFTYLNGRAEQIFGRARNELVGIRLWDAFPDSYGAPPCREYRRAMREQVPVVVVAESSLQPGRWFENHAYPSPEGLSVYAQEITKRHEAERRLEENEQRYRSLFEHNSDAVYAFDLHGTFTAANPACTDLSGYAVHELIDSSFEFLIPEEARRETVERFRRAVAGEPQQYETRLLHSDGHLLDLQVMNIPIIVDGDVVGVYGIAKNITEQKHAERALRQSEQRFRALVENISEAVVVLNETGTVAYASPTLERMSGYCPSERIGNSSFDRMHPDDVTEARLRFRQLLESPGSFIVTTARMRHRDGTWRRVELIAKNLLQDPEIRGIVVTYKDVTERVRLEDQLRQSQKMEAVGRLAGGIAHDFNNQMTVVRGHVELLLEDLSADDPLRDAIEEIGDAAIRAAALTRKLLAFSRRQMLLPRVLDPGELILGMERLLRRAVTERVELRLDLDPAVGCVRADPTQLEQILVNLAVNARDAMPEGGTLRIETSGFTMDPDFASGFAYQVRTGDYVRLRVADTGHGMDAGTLAHVFEPFFTTKQAGTGLGLATVYGIVKQSEGYIWADSRSGGGATFTILLPRVDSADEEARSFESHDVTLPGGSETVLVAEDEDAVRRLISRVLGRGGYRVLEASNGAEALRIAHAHGGRIDMVVSDLVMPGVGGRDLIRALRERWPDLPALLLSGYSDGAVRDQGFPGLDVLFREKPVTPTELLRTVREALDATSAPRPA